MNAASLGLAPPLPVMMAKPAACLPDGERYSYEPKLDGFRCLAFRGRERVVLQSRQQRWLTQYFPEVAAAVLEQLPMGTVVDGELVIYADGRCDFTALQRRIHPSAVHAARRSAVAPATLVLFDVLAVAGVDVRGEPLRRRRKQLRRLLAGARLPLALMPATRDVTAARTWMTDHMEAGVEGLVVKDRGHGYRPNRRTWAKVRTRATAEAVVGGVLGPLDAPEALLLGLHDGQGRLRVAGRTGVLQAAGRREVGALLREPGGVHPWPATIPSSRFGQLPPEPVLYTPAEPLLVVEVDTDVCFEQGRWRHPTVYRRPRLDLRPDDV